MILVADVPQIPRRLTDPVPVLSIVLLGWIIATVIVSTTGDHGSEAVATCWAGVALGILGFLIFLVQRAASRRGSRTAQRGLN